MGTSNKGHRSFNQVAVVLKTYPTSLTMANLKEFPENLDKVNDVSFVRCSSSVFVISNLEGLYLRFITGNQLINFRQ